MCSFGSIPTGESRQVVITAKANGNGTLTNTATATSDGETLTGDNTDSFIVPVYQPTCGAFFANSTRCVFGGAAGFEQVQRVANSGNVH